MSERAARADVTIGRAAGIGFFHSIAGHFWTAAPQLLDFVRRSPQAGWPLLLPIYDPGVGRITLRAVHHEIESADSVVIIVHGIGGTADSGYCQAAASAANAAGYSAVRMSLRGADGTGDDIYHACLTDDLQAVLKSPQLRRYRCVYLLGYSQGGLMVLHAAAARIDRRLAGVAAICPPLDLRSAMENFDRKRFFLHKRLMNARANRFYAAVERTGRAHCTLAQLQRAHSCAAWNQLTIVPRFGFRDVDDYYNSASMMGRWSRLQTPALLVFSRHDPILPRAPIERQLRNLPSNIDVRWLASGGHVHFPASASLGEEAAPGIESQCIAWLIRNSSSAHEFEKAV